VILIISDHYDIQVYHVTYYLKKRGAAFAHFNVADFPGEIKYCSCWRENDHAEYLSLPEGCRLDCSEIKSVWYRKPEAPQVSKDLSQLEKEYTFDECKEALSGIYNNLRDAFWISPIANIRHAGNKPLQLRLASSLGLRIPDTLITNDPEEAKSFYAAHAGEIVYKTMSKGRMVSREGAWEQASVHGEIYTTPLGNFSPIELDRLAYCPGLLQAYIPKLYEIRATVVGTQVFAAEIHSQDSLAAMHDWRRGSLLDVKHRIHNLPKEISDRLVGLVKILGLRFGAIDLIYTPKHEYVFLEINANGQYGWIEGLTSMPISQTIAQALIDRDC
jgi:glutathione synthase/RimK-type ligase-like ATP-grasp enzyme